MSKPVPRHGTRARHDYRGCDCPACVEATRVYKKRQRQGRLQPSFIDPCGTVRRLRGLIAEGWTASRLADLLGADVRHVSRLYLDDTLARRITRATARAVRELCDRIGHDAPPDGTAADRSRSRAERNGWVPLYAWDGVNIDDPRARPHLAEDVDEVAIRRVIDGHARYGDLRLAERRELIRQHHGRVPNLSTRIGMSGAQYKRWVAELCEVAA